MSIIHQGDTFTSDVSNAPTGLTGTIGFRLRDVVTATDVLARTTAGITEIPSGSGIYRFTGTAPVAGEYERIWDTGGGSPEYAIDEDNLVVYEQGAAPDVYFSISELRARFPRELADTTAYETAALEGWRAYVEERIEKACDVAFVPRTVTGKLVNGSGSTSLELPNTRVRTITTATDSGTSVDLTGALVDDGSVYLAAGWTLGTRNLTVTYTHGYDAPPLAIKEAAMLWTREMAVKGPITERQTQIATESGATINLATPGLLGSISGLPVVDEVLAEYRQPSFVG